MTGVEIKEIKGGDFMEEVVYLDKKSGEEKALKAQGLFVNVGWSPSSSFFAKGFFENKRIRRNSCRPENQRNFG